MEWKVEADHFKTLDPVYRRLTQQVTLLRTYTSNPREYHRLLESVE
jgi:hypothetical protein